MSTNNSKRNLSSGISAFACAAALMMAAPAYAQVETATLQGHVDGANAGTQVVAVDTLTGQRATGTVDASGNYEILGLRPSTYSVTVEGRESQTTTLNVGQTAVVDFVQAPAAGAAGAIVVTGRRVREVRTATVSTSITPAQIENLPQNKRNFLSFAALAPGVQVTSGETAQVQAGGIASQFVNVFLDGMSFKNPINHGGVFGQNFGLGNPFPQIAIQEYVVETQNFGAETGQAGSAVISAITKTGGNDFHGSAFIEFQPKAFIDELRFTSGPKPDYNRKQYGGEIGGPIIPGKVHFYVAAERTNQVRPSVIGNRDPNLFPANLVALTNVSHNRDFEQGLYFGKITGYLTDRDTVNLIGYIRREDNLTDIDQNATADHGRRIRTDQDRFQLQWRHNAGSFLNQLNIAYDKGTQDTPTVTSGPDLVLLNPGNASFSEGIQAGAHFFTQADRQKSWTIKNDSTLRFAGEHTLKFGGQIVRLDLSRTEVNAFNGRYYFENPCPSPSTTLCPVQNFDFNTSPAVQARINTQPTATANAKDTMVGLYIQDEWKPDNHWTVNAGIRWDYESNPNNNNYVTPQVVADALRAYPGWAARGIDPEDYISTGDNRDRFYGAFQPRLGVAYDVKGDRDLVFFAGAGRYYDRQLFIQGVRERLKNQSREVDLFFCPNGGPAQGTGSGIGIANCAQWTDALRDPDTLRAFAAASADAAGRIGAQVEVLNNKTKMPYSDQFNLGVRKRFGDIQTSFTFSHIRSHNIQMMVRANFFENGWFTRVLIRDGAGNVIGCTDGGDAWIWDTVSGSLPGVSPSVCPAQSGLLPGWSGKLNRGMSDGKANYNALYVTAEKPFTDQSTWGFTTALTLQRARANVAQELNSDEFYNGTAMDVFGWQNVNGVPKWSWVTSANFRAPYGFILSGLLTLNSGPAFGHIQAPWNSSIQFPDRSGGGSDVIRGNLGGVYWPKKEIAYKRLDLRVAKTFKMPWGGHELTADFEVFNVFNWLNRNYPSWDAGGGDNPPREFDSQIAGDQRAFQAGLRYKF